MEKRRRSELLAEADGPEGYLVDAGEAISDLAYWEASDFHEMLSAMKWATMGLFSTGLYHLTEQYLVELPLAILRFHQGNDLQWKRSVQPNAAIAWFKEELGLDVNELRLVANVMKHAEGDSAQQLRQVNPSHFVYPALRAQGGRPSPMRLTTPIFGQGIYITADTFSKFHRASMSFWMDFADRLPALSR